MKRSDAAISWLVFSICLVITLGIVYAAQRIGGLTSNIGNSPWNLLTHIAIFACGWLAMESFWKFCRRLNVWTIACILLAIVVVAALIRICTGEPL